MRYYLFLLLIPIMMVPVFAVEDNDFDEINYCFQYPTLDKLIANYPAENVFDNRNGSLGTKVMGTNGNDLMIASVFNYTTMFGRGGDDCMIGSSVGNTLFGGKGHDNLDGGSGDDILRGGKGRDVIYGGSGDDRLRGGSGDDHLEGGSGDDILRGGSGDDMLDGRSGNRDTCYDTLGYNALIRCEIVRIS